MVAAEEFDTSEPAVILTGGVIKDMDPDRLQAIAEILGSSFGAQVSVGHMDKTGEVTLSREAMDEPFDPEPQAPFTLVIPREDPYNASYTVTALARAHMERYRPADEIPNDINQSVMMAIRGLITYGLLPDYLRKDGFFTYYFRDESSWQMPKQLNVKGITINNPKDLSDHIDEVKKFLTQGPPV